jgi:hypothetical protein
MPRVVFTKGASGHYWSHVHRPDGTVVLLTGYDRKYRVPHDLAHLVTERELRITDGVFGSIMAGALFASVRVVSGRARHDARRRSERVIKANTASRALGTAELMAGLVHHAVETGKPADVAAEARRQWGSLREEPFPYRAAELRCARDRLAEYGTRWQSLPEDGELDIPWLE